MVAPPRTEQVNFNSLKPQRKEALATIDWQARLLGLRVEAIEERPKRLSVDMHVTVTGAEESIVSFCKAAGGIRAQDPKRGRFRRSMGTIIEVILNNWR